MKLTIKHKETEIKYEQEEDDSVIGYDGKTERICGLIVVMCTQVKELVNN